MAVNSINDVQRHRVCALSVVHRIRIDSQKYFPQSFYVARLRITVQLRQMMTERLTLLVGVHRPVAPVAIQHVVGHVVVRPQLVCSVDAAVYQFRHRRFSAGVNLYWMNYKNQFVLTGELNDVGEAVTKNIGKSYRLGVELEAAWMPTDWFRWDANATLSKNRAKDMIITLEDYTTQVNVGETPLSFSPEVIFNNIFTLDYKGWSASIQSQYVGEQYLTNYGVKTMRCWSDWSQTDDVATDETLMLKDHFTTNIDLSYRFNLRKLGLKNARVGIAFYNLFSAKFDNNGWAAPQFRQDADGKVYAVNTWGLRDQEAAGFAPSAPFHLMSHLSLTF